MSSSEEQTTETDEKAIASEAQTGLSMIPTGTRQPAAIGMPEEEEEEEGGGGERERASERETHMR